MVSISVLHSCYNEEFLSGLKLKLVKLKSKLLFEIVMLPVQKCKTAGKLKPFSISMLTADQRHYTYLPTWFDGMTITRGGGTWGGGSPRGGPSFRKSFQGTAAICAR